MPEISRHPWLRQRIYHSELIERIKHLSPREILAKTNRVRESFIRIPIYEGLDHEGHSYPYSFFELTADKPFRASLFEDAADLIIHSHPESFENADIILSEGDRGGGPLSQAIGRKTNIPVALANWHKEIPDGLPDVIVVKTEVGFSGVGYIVVSGIKPGQRVVIVDDLLSTGGTAEALIKAIQKAGAYVEEIFFVGEKVNKNGRNYLNQLFQNINITSLVRFIGEIENSVTIDADL